jgi:hypothetical protein
MAYPKVCEGMRHERVRRRVGDGADSTVQHLERPDELCLALALRCRVADCLAAGRGVALLRREGVPDPVANALAMQLDPVVEVLDEIGRRAEETVFRQDLR